MHDMYEMIMSDVCPVYPTYVQEIDRKKHSVIVTERWQREEAPGRLDACYYTSLSVICI